jgi:tRNA(fMet)-specific endonuclease VapC
LTDLLLDTSICIELLNGTAEVVAELKRYSPDELKLCSIVKSELLFGARKSLREQENLELLARFFQPFESLPFTDRTAEEAALIRAELYRMGAPIGPNDLLIAAVARAHDLALVTRNVREFQRVVGLKVVEW